MSVEKLVNKIELGILENVSSSKEVKSKLLPLKDSSILWNLFNSKKFNSIFSFKDFEEILLYLKT